MLWQSRVQYVSWQLRHTTSSELYTLKILNWRSTMIEALGSAYMSTSVVLVILLTGVAVISVIGLLVNFAACNFVGMVSYKRAPLDILKSMGSVLIQGTLAGCAAVVLGFGWPLIVLFGLAVLMNRDLRMLPQRRREERMEYLLEHGKDRETVDKDNHQKRIDMMCQYYTVLVNLDGLLFIRHRCSSEIIEELQRCYNKNNPDKQVKVKRSW